MRAVEPSVSWQDNLTVVLVESRNPLNIGAAARAMLNFGFTRMALVAPYEVAFQEARSAVGAASVLYSARMFPALADALIGCTLVVGTASAGKRVFRQPRRLLPEAASLLRTHLEEGRAALLFGSEKFGLSNEHLSYCHWTLRIPTNPRCPSMNLGQAVALCCYELARAAEEGGETREEGRGDAGTGRRGDTGTGRRGDAGTGRRGDAGTGGRGDAGTERRGDAGMGRRGGQQHAAADQLERIVERLVAVLDASGYIQARTRRSHLLKIRRLVGRLGLSPNDARVFEGMLRQIGWKLARDSRKSGP